MSVNQRLTDEDHGGLDTARPRVRHHSLLALPGGRIAGVDPVSGTRLEAPAIRALPSDDRTRAASATVAADAADLDCLLWNRPPIDPQRLSRTGRATAPAAFDAMIARVVH